MKMDPLELQINLTACIPIQTAMMNDGINQCKPMLNNPVNCKRMHWNWRLGTVKSKLMGWPAGVLLNHRWLWSTQILSLDLLQKSYQAGFPPRTTGWWVALSVSCFNHTSYHMMSTAPNLMLQSFWEPSWSYNKSQHQSEDQYHHGCHFFNKMCLKLSMTVILWNMWSGLCWHVLDWSWISTGIEIRGLS